MDTTLQAHLRYPQDLFAMQAQMYGTYHVTSAATFYANQNAWNLSPISTGANGSSSASLPQQANGQPQRYMPIYEMMQLAGDSQPVFRSVEPLVRKSQGTIQPMTSIVVADSSFSTYGDLSAYDTPQTATVLSPGLVNATILANQAVSKQLSLLDQGGSTVTLGTVQILPIADSLLYVRPLYVSSSQTQYPLLQYVIVLYGKQVEMEPTLSAALGDLFGGAPELDVDADWSGDDGLDLDRGAKRHRQCARRVPSRADRAHRRQPRHVPVRRQPGGPGPRCRTEAVDRFELVDELDEVVDARRGDWSAM